MGTDGVGTPTMYPHMAPEGSGNETLTGKPSRGTGNGGAGHLFPAKRARPGPSGLGAGSSRARGMAPASSSSSADSDEDVTPMVVPAALVAAGNKATGAAALLLAKTANEKAMEKEKHKEMEKAKVGTAAKGNGADGAGGPRQSKQPGTAAATSAAAAARPASQPTPMDEVSEYEYESYSEAEGEPEAQAEAGTEPPKLKKSRSLTGALYEAPKLPSGRLGAEEMKAQQRAHEDVRAKARAARNKKNATATKKVKKENGRGKGNAASASKAGKTKVKTEGGSKAAKGQSPHRRVEDVEGYSSSDEYEDNGDDDKYKQDKQQQQQQHKTSAAAAAAPTLAVGKPPHMLLLEKYLPVTTEKLDKVQKAGDEMKHQADSLPQGFEQRLLKFRSARQYLLKAVLVEEMEQPKLHVPKNAENEEKDRLRKVAQDAGEHIYRLYQSNTEYLVRRAKAFEAAKEHGYAYAAWLLVASCQYKVLAYRIGKFDQRLAFMKETFTGLAINDTSARWPSYKFRKEIRLEDVTAKKMTEFTFHYCDMVSKMANLWRMNEQRKRELPKDSPFATLAICNDALVQLSATETVLAIIDATTKKKAK